MKRIKMNVSHYRLLCVISLFCGVFCTQVQGQSTDSSIEVAYELPDTVIEVDYAKLPCHVNKDSSIKYPTVPKYFDAYPYWSWTMTFPHLPNEDSYVEPTLADALERPVTATRIRFTYDTPNHSDTLNKKDRKEKMREIFLFRKNLHKFSNLNSISLWARPSNNLKGKNLEFKKKCYSRILKIIAKSKTIKHLYISFPEQNDLLAISKMTFLEELGLNLFPERQSKLTIPGEFSNLKNVNRLIIDFSLKNTDSLSNIYKMSGLKALNLKPYGDKSKINFFNGISQLKKLKLLQVLENNRWDVDIDYSSLEKELAELNLIYLYVYRDFRSTYKDELNELKHYSKYYYFKYSHFENFDRPDNDTNLPMILLETKNWTDKEWAVFYDRIAKRITPWN